MLHAHILRLILHIKQSKDEKLGKVGQIFPNSILDASRLKITIRNEAWPRIYTRIARN